MRKINNVVTITIYIITLFTNSVYSLDFSQDTLRVPLAKHTDILSRAKQVEEASSILHWSTLEQGIASVRYVLSRERLSIIERYDNLGSLSETQIELLRNDIYKIHQGYFNVWGLSRAMDIKGAPDFNGSYITVLQKVFPDLHLNPLGFQLDWSTSERRIASVRYVLSRERPSIIERYDNLGSLDEAQIELLRNDIYKITSSHFYLWEIGIVMDVKYIPDFNGSYITTLQKVFPDLHLNPLGFHLDWSTLKQGIASVRYVLSMERPDIIKRYDNIGSLDEAQIELLRNDIYRITHGHFLSWGLSVVMDSKLAPYFNGSYIIALKAVFSDPKLGFSEEELVRFRKAARVLRYKWKTKKEGVSNVMAALRLNIPDIVERYDNLGSLSKADIELLRNDIYKITQGHFRLWGLRSALDPKYAPYFKGSLITALQIVFPNLNIDPLGFQLDWSTPEQRIASIRYVLSRERPSIIERYDKLGSLSEAQIDLLRNDIYKINQGYFSIWGLATAMDINTVPDFNGTYITPLQKTFPDLNLNPLGFHLDWSTLEQGIASIRYVLSRERSKIIERYDNLGSLSPAQIELLREDIYKITLRYFLVWGLIGAQNSKAVPYFKGSHITALQKVFPVLKLQRSNFDARGQKPDRGILSKAVETSL